MKSQAGCQWCGQTELWSGLRGWLLVRLFLTERSSDAQGFVSKSGHVTHSGLQSLPSKTVLISDSSNSLRPPHEGSISSAIPV